MKMLKLIKKFLGSHFFVMLLIGLLYGLTAVSPEILTNPIIFGNYLIFILLNTYISESEKRDNDREYQSKIDNLQRQIDMLVKQSNHK